MIISNGTKLDVRTFTERKDKPYILPDGLDAFELFMPRIQALALDFVAGILHQEGSASPRGEAKDYIQQLIHKSKVKAGIPLDSPVDIPMVSGH